MNILLLASILPTIRFLFLIHFLWEFSFFSFYCLIVFILQKYFSFTLLPAISLLWVFYILSQVFSSFIGLLQDYWIGIKKSIQLALIICFISYIGLWFLMGIFFNKILLYILLATMIIVHSIVKNGLSTLIARSCKLRFDNFQAEQIIITDYFIKNLAIFLGIGLTAIFIYLLDNVQILLLLPVGTIGFTILCLILFKDLLLRSGNTIDLQSYYKKNYYLYSILIIFGLIFGIVLIIYSLSNMLMIFLGLLCAVLSGIFFISRFFKENTKFVRLRLIFILITLILLFVYYILYYKSLLLIKVYIFHFLNTSTFNSIDIFFKPYFYTFFHALLSVFAALFIFFIKKYLKKNHIQLSLSFHIYSVIILSFLSFLLLYLSTFYIHKNLSIIWMVLFFMLRTITIIILSYSTLLLFIKLVPLKFMSLGLGLKTTIITLPILLIPEIGTAHYNLNLNSEATSLFFQSEFLSLLIFSGILLLFCIIFLPFLQYIFRKNNFFIESDQYKGV